MTRRRASRWGAAVCALALVTTGTAVATATAAEAPAPANNAPAATSPAPADLVKTASAAGVAGGGAISLSVPASGQKPAYDISVGLSPFKITTLRAGKVVLATGAAGLTWSTSSGAPVSATQVTSVNYQANKLVLTVATSNAGTTAKVTITPAPGQYAMTVTPSATPRSIALDYNLTASGHWYGNGEATTPAGGPYTDQPWPLDTGTVQDSEFSAASYNMDEPFWFTQAGSGLSVATQTNMSVSIGAAKTPHDGIFAVDDSKSLNATVYVGRNPKEVYNDYIAVAGHPTTSPSSDEFAAPAWNSWAQFYTTVTQQKFTDWAKGIHASGIGASSFSLDDGWMSHYGDFTFNSKFPDPKAMVDQVHSMGAKFGLWMTLWENLDSANYKIAAAKGYLLKSKADPSKPCTVTWWNGTAGIIDLANPAANKWFTDQIAALKKSLGVDGFKFDTRFYDPSCATDAGTTAQDYTALGARFAGQYDLLGMGIRTHWTGAQKYGFTTREIDKGTSWASLGAAFHQVLALSTVGYPYVTTDMIGGSDGGTPPTKEVLVRWAQAAAVIPSMYSSTSPLGLVDQAGKPVVYDAQTVQLYKKAVALHQGLLPYIQTQIARTVKTGEPIVKPIFFDYPADQASYSLGDEWLLGDSMLVAPMLTAGTTRSLHLPAGQWFDVNNQKVLTGPLTIAKYQVPLSQVPMFVKLGTADSAKAMKAAAASRA